MTRILPNPGLRLMEVIGSPFLTMARNLDWEVESNQLLQLALKNKVLLLYLESLNRMGAISAFESRYAEEKARHVRLLDVVTGVSRALNGVEYAIFKTVRPYPAVPSDIDVMIMGDDLAYKAAIMALLKQGYGSLLPDMTRGIDIKDPVILAQTAEKLTRQTFGADHISPKGTNLVDPETGFHVDLQRNLSVSSLTYMDKDRFKGYVARRKLPDGREISGFKPDLEMVIVLAHSISERELRLGEFYTWLYFLKDADDNAVDGFLEHIGRNRLGRAAAAFITISVCLHQGAWGEVPEKLLSLQKRLGECSPEARALVQHGYALPHRFTGRTLWEVFGQKLGENKFRKSVVVQGIRALDPRWMRLAYRELKGKR